MINGLKNKMNVLVVHNEMLMSIFKLAKRQTIKDP